jgi:hypothetical protein
MVSTIFGTGDCMKYAKTYSEISTHRLVLIFTRELLTINKAVVLHHFNTIEVIEVESQAVLNTCHRTRLPAYI